MEVIDFRKKTLDQTIDLYIEYGVIDGFTGQVIQTIEDENKKALEINKQLDIFFKNVKWIEDEEDN